MFRSGCGVSARQERHTNTCCRRSKVLSWKRHKEKCPLPPVGRTPGNIVTTQKHTKIGRKIGQRIGKQHQCASRTGQTVPVCGKKMPDRSVCGAVIREKQTHTAVHLPHAHPILRTGSGGAAYAASCVCVCISHFITNRIYL